MTTASPTSARRVSISTPPAPHNGSAHTDAPTPPSEPSTAPSSEPSTDTAPPTPTRRTKFLPPIRVPPVTLVLTNSGSVARDHLASERTWLSYVRTSLGVASTGVALVQLFTISEDENGVITPHEAKIQRFARPLGAVTVLLGLYVLVIGVQRYFLIQHSLTQGEFPVARVTVLGITGLLAVLVSVTFGVLVAIPRR